LKGIGPYTAAAIGSICFNLPEAAVDGNVFRVLARYYGIENSIDETSTKKLISMLSNEALNRKNAGDYNQAMMELGATICTPKSPKCELCPLEINCVAKKKSLQSILPVRSKKTKVRNRYFHYLVRISAGETFLVRRGEGDIWQGLYEFPMVESDRELNEQEMLKVLEIGISDVVKSISKEYKHILSHQKISAKFVCVESEQIKNSNFIRVEVDKLSSFAFPRLIKRFLERKNFVITEEV
jgi:A/G-specific adenine glycosylase